MTQIRSRFPDLTQRICRGLLFFTLCANPRLYCNAIIAGWGEATMLEKNKKNIVRTQMLLKDWIMSWPASYYMWNSSPCIWGFAQVSSSTSSLGELYRPFVVILLCFGLLLVIFVLKMPVAVSSWSPVSHHTLVRTKYWVFYTFQVESLA